MINSLSSNTDEFIKKARNIHGDKYDYSEVKYVGNKKQVKVICNKKDKDGVEHGSWMTTPNLHLSGSGCQKCGWERTHGWNQSNTDEFIKRSRKIHGDKYDYDNVKYTKRDKDVIIVCHKKDKEGKEHGPWLSMPGNHLRGSGCPKCVNSKGENIIERLLQEQGIYYIDQYKNEYCYSFRGINKNRKCSLLKFDFYLPHLKIIIEYDGAYHFQKHHSNTDESFMFDVLNDREKNNFTKLKGIKLIRISYLDVKNIEKELINGFKSENQLYLSTNYETDKGWSDDNLQPTDEWIKKYT
jgi:very-short-patch-repair endonuclease